MICAFLFHVIKDLDGVSHDPQASLGLGRPELKSLLDQIGPTCYVL